VQPRATAVDVDAWNYVPAPPDVRSGLGEESRINIRLLRVL
jgi:hypothetical protein